MDENFLALLVCPETKQSLRRADGAILEVLNSRIAQGGITNRAGVRIDAPLIEALIRSDGAVLYPVVDDIPVMLIDDSIDLAGHGIQS